MKPKKVFIYEVNGKEPYSIWLKSLPISDRARIMARIARVERGAKKSQKKDIKKAKKCWKEYISRRST